MASESCWIRYSEPSWLRSWRDTSHDRVLSPPRPLLLLITLQGQGLGNSAPGEETAESVTPEILWMDPEGGGSFSFEPQEFQTQLSPGPPPWDLPSLSPKSQEAPLLSLYPPTHLQHILLAGFVFGGPGKRGPLQLHRVLGGRELRRLPLWEREGESLQLGQA